MCPNHAHYSNTRMHTRTALHARPWDEWLQPLWVSPRWERELAVVGRFGSFCLGLYRDGWSYALFILHLYSVSEMSHLLLFFIESKDCDNIT